MKYQSIDPKSAKEGLESHGFRVVHRTDTEISYQHPNGLVASHSPNGKAVEIRIKKRAGDSAASTIRNGHSFKDGTLKDFVDGHSKS